MKTIKIVKKLQKMGYFSLIAIDDNGVQATVSEHLDSYDLGYIYDEFHKDCDIKLIAESDELLLNITPKPVEVEL
ncbi:TPA: hypothetical protein I9Y90_000066 [Elizabethkingia anophelis]|nr:hypothetical protein [Elizabethkingia anophelis]HAT4009589.1 hypothetical protein [Elizabethkingia anophelis]